MPDPLLERLAPEDLPPSLRAAHARSMALRGDGTFFEVFGHHPDLYRWYAERFYGEVFRGGLVARRTKELVRLRLSGLHGCRFCNQGNRHDALDAGIDAASLDALDDYERGPFDEAEKAALRLADRLSLTAPKGRLDRALYDALRAHYSDAQILELGLLLGVLSGVAKFLFAFDLVEKETNCRF